MINRPQEDKKAELEIRNLRLSFGGVVAVQDVDMTVHTGELMAVIGPNGAGKSTFFDLLSGRAKPDIGKVEFGDIDLTKLDECTINQLGIGRKFQAPSVYVQLTVWDNIRLSLKGPRSVWSSLSRRLSSTQSDRIDEILRLIRLDGKARLLAGQLAHGEKQWLEIGMLLMQEPKLLLLDEPVAGMTDEETERTAELFLSLKGKHSLMVVEHDMSFIRTISEIVTVLCDGSVLAQGTLDQVQSDERVIEVYLGR